MTKSILPLLLLLTGIAHAQEKVLTAGMKINKSAKIKKAIYQLDANTLKNTPVIIIEGKNITIDFNNAELRGSRGKLTPDQFFGTAIIIRNSSNVTIKNLKARGYKIALKAINVNKLVLDNCDLSYNYRQHLNSTQEKEDISDWMSYHHNEKDEWLRYGAAIYLDSCNAFTVKNCIVTGGQNALMMTQCNNGWVYNNDFSFNSGIGIGMYRSSANNIMYNKIVFNVRGYSHGVYSRGQDSAGILVYEQSSDNLFYRNNVTHGGDGFFLWAGQTTMDSGVGGCNNNRIIKNDFSYAPANGIEVTFSSNQILDNRIYECDHGIWGGYSYNSRIADNKFRNNRIGIAIEHGQNNGIHHNMFLGDKEAVRLWARKQQSDPATAGWGYAQKRDTRSRQYALALNSFNDVPLIFNINDTDSVAVFDNVYANTETTRFKIDSTVTNLDTFFNDDWNNYILADTAEPIIPQIADQPADPFAGTGRRAGRKNIRITEWGPYDFRSPLIWNTNPTDSSGSMQFDLIGPKGKWVIKKASGVTDISAMSGEFPASITANKVNNGNTDINIELQYTGEAIVTPMGQTIVAGKPYAFSFKKFFQPLDWEVLFYSLDTTYHNPITKGSLFSPTERKAPFKTDHVKELSYAWWGGIKEKDIQHKQFITVANAEVDIPPGQYELSVTWDDAVRIYQGEKLILNEWSPSKYSFDESPNRKITINVAGKFYLRVEHLELGGFATLALKLIKK